MESPTFSQIVTDVEFAVVELIVLQEEMQLPLLL